jgi:integrase/recombinase XerD
MPREFIQELRGDLRKEAIDIYDHIDKKELRESYLAKMPQLGVRLIAHFYAQSQLDARE